MKTPDKNKIFVVAALIWKNGRFLACKRPEGKARAHLWEFVGGKVEPNETPKDALRRECAEELALDVEPKTVFFHTVHEYDDVAVDLTLFECTAHGEPQMKEHEDMRWLLPSEADNYEFCPADEVILQKLKRL